MGEGKAINITYETLFDILRNEKNRDALQQLDPTFYKDVVDYINSKQQLITQKPDTELFAGMEKQKTQKQLENIKKIVKELYERREKKISNMALIGSRTASILDKSSLLPEEQRLFEELTKIFDNYRANLLFKILRAEELAETKPAEVKPAKTDKPQAPKDTKLVRFLKAVPKFVGKELEVYGPFEEEDVANLPTEIAELLVLKGRAEEIQG